MAEAKDPRRVKRKNAWYWIGEEKLQFCMYVDKTKDRSIVCTWGGQVKEVETDLLVKNRFSINDLRHGRVFTNEGGTRVRYCLGCEMFYTYYKSKPGSRTTSGVWTGAFLNWAQEVYESWEDYEKAVGSAVAGQ